MTQPRPSTSERNKKVVKALMLIGGFVMLFPFFAIVVGLMWNVLSVGGIVLLMLAMLEIVGCLLVFIGHRLVKGKWLSFDDVPPYMIPDSHG